jgi:TRAP-type uncharacterized transport system substrate-binding protein
VAASELHLAFMGDWGVANFHLASGWIANGLRHRSARTSRFVIHTLGPYATMLDALIDGTVDVAFAQALVGARWARAGAMPFRTAHPELVTLGVLPHRDRVLFALPEATAQQHGLRTLGDLATKRPALRVTVGARDGLVGAAAERLLTAHGIEWDDIPAWGGEWIVVERPQPAIGQVASGRADAILFEGIMNWYAADRHSSLRVLVPEPAAFPALRRSGLDIATLDAGEFSTLAASVEVADFSGWAAMCRTDMPEATAALIARVMAEDRAILETRYHDKPVRDSALVYPIQPRELARSGDVPLHPGAASFYREAGLL